MSFLPLSTVVKAFELSLASSVLPSSGFAVADMKIDLPAELSISAGEVLIQIPDPKSPPDPSVLTRITFTLGATSLPDERPASPPWLAGYTGTGESLYGLTGQGVEATVVGANGVALGSLDGGLSWTPAAIPTKTRLHAVVRTPSGGAIAAGAAGKIFFQQSPGAPWKSVPSPTKRNINGLFVSGGLIYAAVSAGELLLSKDEGQSFGSLGTFSSDNLHAVGGGKDGPLFVVGANGTILYSKDGFNFSPMASGTKKNLYGVYGFGEGLAWAVGEKGKILRFSGQKSFDPLPSGTGENLYAVAGEGPTQLFAVGRGGVALRSTDGKAWTQVETPTTQALHAVWTDGPDNVLVAGTGGVVLRWTGGKG